MIDSAQRIPTTVRRIASLVLVALCSLFFASSVARSDDTEPADAFEPLAHYDAARPWLDPDAYLVGVADTTAGPGFEIFAGLLPDKCPKYECEETPEARKEATIEKMRSAFVKRFRSQLRFDPTDVDSLVFGVGPRWATVVARGQLDFDAPRAVTHQVAKRTVYQLEPRNRYDSDIWALELPDGAGIVLMTHLEGMKAALGVEGSRPPTVNAPRRAAALRARLQQAGDVSFAMVFNILDGSLLDQINAAAHDPLEGINERVRLPRASTLAIISDGTLTTEIVDGDGALTAFAGASAEHGTIDDYARAFRNPDEAFAPAEVLVGILQRHLLGETNRRSAKDRPPQDDEPVTESYELGAAPPVGMIATYFAMSLPAMGQRVAQQLDEARIAVMRQRMEAIADKVIAYYEASGERVGGELRCSFPPLTEKTRNPGHCCEAPDAQRTLEAPICEDPKNAWRAEAWQAIDFSIDVPHSFAYQLQEGLPSDTHSQIVIAADRPTTCEGRQTYGRLYVRGEVRDGKCKAEKFHFRGHIDGQMSLSTRY